MTENIPKICAAFEMWQNNDCIKPDITLELIMRYLADDPRMDHVVSNMDQDRAYRDYIGRQNENLNAKTLIIRELNTQVAQIKSEQTIDEDCVGCCEVVDVAAKLQRELDECKERIHKSQVTNDNRVMIIERLKEEIDSLDAALSVRKEDSKVLIKVVEIVKNWDDSTGRAFPTLIKILDELMDYIDAPEGPPETPIDDLYKTTVSVFLEMP